MGPRRTGRLGPVEALRVALDVRRRPRGVGLSRTGSQAGSGVEAGLGGNSIGWMQRVRVPPSFAGLNRVRTGSRRSTLPGERGWHIEVAEEAVCPTIEIEGGWDDYLGSLRSRDRREVRRKLRPLRQLRGAVGFEAVESPSDVAARMPEFMAMMAESRGDKAVFLTDEMRVFFERLSSSLSEAGWLRLYVMSVSGEAAGDGVVLRRAQSTAAVQQWLCSQVPRPVGRIGVEGAVHSRRCGAGDVERELPARRRAVQIRAGRQGCGRATAATDAGGIVMLRRRRLAVMSTHTSPRARAGTTKAGGMNVYVR